MTYASLLLKWFGMMAEPQGRLSHCLSISILAAGILLAPGYAAADVIVDDFDDPVSLDLPIASAFEVVMQEDVGPLSAERWTEIVDTNIEAMGAVSSHDSVLDWRVDETNPDDTSLTLQGLALNMRYFLDAPIDASSHDFLAVDFSLLESSIGVVPRIDAFLEDTDRSGASFVSQLFDVAASGRASTIYYPLESFRLRAGSGGETFDNVDEVVISVSLNWLSVIEPSFQSRVQIDRIRFTSVPEPSTLSAVTLLGAGCFTFRLRRKRKWEVAQSRQRVHWWGAG